MFKRIVSQLSLSPAAASELAFYARRLKQERVTRYFSVVAAVLVVALQIAVIAAPPSASNAASSNDIVYGGIISRDDMLNRYDGSPELKALYARFGIARSDLAATRTVTITSADTSLYSIGRVKHWSDDREIQVGNNTFYGRQLHKWDTGSSSHYKVLEGTRSGDGGYFAVMFACGNIIYRQLPQAPVTPHPTVAPAPAPHPVTPSPLPATLLPTPNTTPVPASTAPTPKVVVKATATPNPTSLACVSLSTDTKSGAVPTTVNLTTQGTAVGQTITGYIYDYGDGATETLTSAQASHSYNKGGVYTASVRIKGSLGAVSAAVPTCSVGLTITAPPASFVKGKQAYNLTQNLDATTRPAAPSDKIRYRLTTTNTGGTVASYSVVEHLEDVVEYADVTDNGGGTLAGCTQASDACTLTWAPRTIEPGQMLAQEFVVTVKNPVPTMPVSTSDKMSYDLRMDNVYGQVVSVNIQPPAVKQVELASQKLPQTGAGLSSLVIGAIAALAVYLFLRNSQLSREVRLLKGDFNGGHQL